MQILHKYYLLLTIFLFVPSLIKAQESLLEKTDSIIRPNKLTIDGQFLTRGEYRYGGLPLDENGEVKKDEKYAAFIMERSRLSIGYERDMFEAKVTAQHSGVWGQSGKGSFNLYEGWIKVYSHSGLFAKVGRQELVYDNERIIGNNDWTMAAQSHDVLKFGIERSRHQLHIILGYNQNSANINGGTEYYNGAEPWKTMQTLWYHYNVPHVPLDVSLLAMNVGTQSTFSEGDKTENQQLIGTYLKYQTKKWKLEGSFYYQMGHSEESLPINAWMGALRGEHHFNPNLSLYGGYDYLSGDESFHVPNIGGFGLQQHKKVNGFNLLFGSHHQFYGAMDFFYLSSFYGGFSPGLQNIYAGTKWSPFQPLSITSTYHYFSTATKVSDSNWTLGHEIELGASYAIMKDVKLSLGYSFMVGTKTMERLKRTADNSNLHWLWLSINASPKIFTTKW